MAIIDLNTLKNRYGKGRPMKPDLSKLHVYGILHTINGGFEQVLVDLKRLEQFGFDRKLLTEFRLDVEEIRAWANFKLIEVIYEREERDWTRCGRSRQSATQFHDQNTALTEARQSKQKKAAAEKKPGKQIRERAR